MEHSSVTQNQLDNLSEAEILDMFKKIQRDGLELFIRKNKDYKNAFAKYGTIGVLMRIEDKISRYLNISRTCITLVSDETLKDTMIDLHNYAAMASMLIEDAQLQQQTAQTK